MDWLKRFKRKTYECDVCKDTGMVEYTVPVPYEEYTPAQRGYTLAFGGHVVRRVATLCTCRL